ncbi:MAG: hypothetical protein GXP47_00305 [Acidobacteria bacterium]|nr:hypothetical protein [Acidobacteriota bacterium]
MEKWEEAMALDIPLEEREDVCQGLLVRDLLHGSSFDVETDDPEAVFSVDFTCGDETEEGVYRLLIIAEIEGTEDHELVRSFTEEVLSEYLEEAASIVDLVEWIGEVAEDEVECRVVPEDEERWDLVVPDWMAPEDAEVPFGFRLFRTADGKPWPPDADLDRFGRVLVVPWQDRLHLAGTPMPEDEE